MTTFIICSAIVLVAAIAGYVATDIVGTGGDTATSAVESTAKTVEAVSDGPLGWAVLIAVVAIVSFAIYHRVRSGAPARPPAPPPPDHDSDRSLANRSHGTAEKGRRQP
jgi:hypothetical protein